MQDGEDAPTGTRCFLVGVVRSVWDIVPPTVHDKSLPSPGAMKAQGSRTQRKAAGAVTPMADNREQ